MSEVLVVAEHQRGQVRDVTRELITAGRRLGPVTVAVIGESPATLRPGVDVEGVDEIVEISVPTAEFESDVYQHAVETLIAHRRPTVVLLGFTVNSMGYGPALAVKLGLGFASDVFAVEPEAERLVVGRAMYGGKVHAEVEVPTPALLMLRPTVWPAAEGAGQATITQIDLDGIRSRARHRGFVEAPASDLDITAADFILAVGRGIESKDNVAYFASLAQKMSATLAASRPLVDAGWLPSARQVGQSGKTVRPKVYLALGISGAVQHVAGMKAAGTIIAVNSDPEAAIFRVAHHGAVADLFEVAKELEKRFG